MTTTKRGCRVTGCGAPAETSLVLADGDHGAEFVPICRPHRAEVEEAWAVVNETQPPARAATATPTQPATDEEQR